jgi:hypothetical protein
VEEELNKEAAVEDVSVGGGVWMIGGVEVDFKRAKNTVNAQSVRAMQKLKVANRFAGLHDDIDPHDDLDGGEPDAFSGAVPRDTPAQDLRGTTEVQYPCEVRRRGYISGPTQVHDFGDYLEDLFTKVGTAKLWDNDHRQEPSQGASLPRHGCKHVVHDALIQDVVDNHFEHVVNLRKHGTWCDNLRNHGAWCENLRNHGA